MSSFNGLNQRIFDWLKDKTKKTFCQVSDENSDIATRILN